MSEFVPVGVYYCRTHHGIANEDQAECDFVDDGEEVCSLARCHIEQSPVLIGRAGCEPKAVAELRPYTDGHGNHGVKLHLWCPACEDRHAINVEATSGAVWQWDGNIDAPTINPSIKVTGVQWAPEFRFHKPRHHVTPGEMTVCHSFVRSGQWQYLGDCTHDLAGQTVPLPPLPDFDQEEQG